MNLSLPSGPPFKFRSSLLVAENRPRSCLVNQLTNQQPSLPPRQSFYFTQRTGKLDARRISRLNLEQIIEDVDINSLQLHLENITFSLLNEETISQYTDAMFLKLFLLAQLLLEYLLSVQDNLAASVESLTGQNRNIQEQCEKTQNELKRYEKIISSLRMEVRQKHRTIERYERLMAIPRYDEYNYRKKYSNDEMSFSACHMCGKLFTTQEFLREHTAKKHNTAVSGQQGRENSPNSIKIKTPPLLPHMKLEQSAAPKQQLRLHVLTPTGNCVQVFVSVDITVGRLKEHIGGTGIACSRFHRLLFLGTTLSNDVILRDTNLSEMSQVLVLPPLHHSNDEEEEGKETTTSCIRKGEVQKYNNLNNSEKFTAALAAIMEQHQIINKVAPPPIATNIDKEGYGEIDIHATEALERRMKQMELSMPQKVEAMLDEGINEVKDVMGDLLAEVRSYHNKVSAAGAIEDDVAQQQYNKGITIQSSRSLSELTSGNDEQNLPSATVASTHQNDRLGFENEECKDTVSSSDGENLNNSGHGSSDDNLLPSEYWLLTFEKEGERPLVQAKVTKSMGVIGDVISVIASMLDVDDERISFVVKNTASALHNLTPVSLLQHYYENDNLDLNIASSHRPPISDFHSMDDAFTLNHAEQDQSNVTSALSDVTLQRKTTYTATSGENAKVKVGRDNATLLHDEEDTANIPQPQKLSKLNTTLENDHPHDAGMVLHSHVGDATTSSSSDKGARDNNPNRSSLLQQQHQQCAMNPAATLPLESAGRIVIDESKENHSCTDDDDNYSSILDSSGGSYDTMGDRNTSTNQIGFRVNTPDFNKTEETDFSVPIDALKRADFYETASGG